MKIVRLTTAGVLVISALLMLFTPALADFASFGFYNISANSVADAAIGESQLFMTVSNDDAILGPNQVMFTFANTGPAASSITDIYLDDLEGDGLLIDIASVSDTGGCAPGTDFEPLASPGNLPSGNTITPPFVTTDGFSADSEPPTQPCGVNPGETVAIIFNLEGGVTYSDIIAALESGDLRVGIHVQGFADGESESFVNRPPTAITLASFAARATGGAVTLEWVTGTEVNNAGFNLYRAATADGPRTKVNPYLLAASGEGASGASYKYLDTPGYGTFFYWLEDVEFTGATALHGPVSLTVVSPIRRPIYRPVLPAGY